MGDTTGISWTDKTFNPWWGCSRVSPACRFCYADAQAKRYGHEVWRRHGDRRMLSDANWAKPLKWNREAEAAGIPAKVFCASMADVFEDHSQVIEPRKRLWGLIESTPWLHWQLLTKRIENVAGMVPWGSSWPRNAWIGTSVENQRYADERIPRLVDLPASVRFLSCEPLIGPVDLFGPADAGCEDAGPAVNHEGYSYPVDYGSGTEYDCEHESGVDWVICGGESGGSKRREMDPEWLSFIASQCQDAGVPVWVKQDSGPRSGLQGRIPDDLWALKQFPAVPEAVAAHG
jgi:protein gp37